MFLKKTPDDLFSRDLEEICKFVTLQIEIYFISKNKMTCESEAKKKWIKVEKILKGSLDLIPSPSHSVKIQITGGKVCLRCKVKTLMDIVNKLLKKKVCWHHPVMFCLITSSKNFNWRWWDWIQAIFLNIFYFNMNLCRK